MSLDNPFSSNEIVVQHHPFTLAEYMHFCSFSLPSPLIFDYHSDLLNQVYCWPADVTFENPTSNIIRCTFNTVCPDKLTLVRDIKVTPEVYKHYSQFAKSTKPNTPRLLLYCKPTANKTKTDLDIEIVLPPESETVNPLSFPEFSAYFFGVTPSIIDRTFSTGFSVCPFKYVYYLLHLLSDTKSVLPSKDQWDMRNTL